MLFGEPDNPMRPTVTHNLIENGFIGVTGSGLADAVIANNDVQSRARNLQFYGNARLTLTGNRFRGPFRCGEFHGTDVSVLDNMVEARLAIGASGTLEVRGNSFEHLGIRGGPAQATIADNTVAELFVGGGGQIALERLEGQELNVKGVVAVTGERQPLQRADQTPRHHRHRRRTTRRAP